MLTDHTNVMVKKKDCQIRHLPLDKSHFITEIKEFNDIMNFLYLGRKEKMKELSTENNTYMILNVLEKGRSV